MTSNIFDREARIHARVALDAHARPLYCAGLERAAVIADTKADNLMRDGSDEPITVEQVVNGYRMIAKLIRAEAKVVMEKEQPTRAQIKRAVRHAMKTGANNPSSINRY